MFKKKKEPRVIYVINKETQEQIVIYGWIVDSKDPDVITVCDARSSTVYNHEFEKSKYDWKYAKKSLFHR